MRQAVTLASRRALFRPSQQVRLFSLPLDEPDAYEVLGVSPSASSEEIRRAFTKLCTKYHPDTGSNKDPELMKQVMSSYGRVKNEKLRAQYDAERQQQHMAQNGFNVDPGMGGMHGGLNLDELLRQMGMGGMGMGGMGMRDIMEMMKRSQQTQGEPIALEVDLSLDEVLDGGEREVTVMRDQVCKSCDGQGEMQNAQTRCGHCHGSGRFTAVQGGMQVHAVCPACGGLGMERNPCHTCAGTGISGSAQETFKITFPPGMQNGDRMRYPRKGHPGRCGGPVGDAVVRFTYKPKGQAAIFERSDSDAFLKQDISLKQAIFGDKITIPGLREEHDVKVPAGTSSGRVLRLQGQGFPLRNSLSKRGDFHVELKVKMPKADDLTEEQQKVLMTLE
ncbi:MAG: hypothetical protein MHM6MM_003769 [Cercozoa sp. M6MM]